MKVSEFFVRTQPPTKNSCFVLMPFAESMQAVYEHGIKPLVESMQMQCRRGDEMYSTQGILSDIWTSIQNAEVIIADLTGRNPNVMYELGLCHALWKKVILLSQNKDDVPFDLRNWRVIWYDFTFAGSARLKDELQRAISALRAEETIESELKPLPLAPIARLVAGPVVREEVGRQTVAWRRGAIASWKRESNFGFVTADGVDYFAHGAEFFVLGDEPRVGDQVIFQVGPPTSPGKAARALEIFHFGTRVRGNIDKTFRDKGFGFINAYSPDDKRFHLFVLLRDDEAFQVGDHVECEISANANGPIGRDLVLVGADEEDGETFNS